MPLYKFVDKNAVQLKVAAFKNERELQKLFEANLDTLLGVRYISSEFATGDRQRGRIDTLGLDQDGTPTIIEYKKTSNQNVINQGLYYLDWLVDHKGDFFVAAQEKLGSAVQIDWANPRLILIAEEFNDYDKYAVNRIGANIELWAYRLYADGILYLDPIFIPAASAKKPSKGMIQTTGGEEEQVPEEIEYDLDWHLDRKPETIQDLYARLRERIFGLGEPDEILEKATKVYIGYKHGKNFAEVAPLKSYIKIWLDISPVELDDPRSLGRDVTKIGHHGTGEIEVKLSDPGDLEYVVGLIRQAYLLTV